MSISEKLKEQIKNLRTNLSYYYDRIDPGIKGLISDIGLIGKDLYNSADLISEYITPVYSDVKAGSDVLESGVLDIKNSGGNYLSLLSGAGKVAISPLVASMFLAVPNMADASLKAGLKTQRKLSNTEQELVSAWREAAKNGDKETAQIALDEWWKLKAPKTLTKGIYINLSRYGNNFTVFDRNKIAGPNKNGKIYDGHTGQFIGIYNPPNRGFFFRPKELFDRDFSTFPVNKTPRQFRLNIKDPRRSYTEVFIVNHPEYKDTKLFNNLYVPEYNDGIVTYHEKHGKIEPFEVLAMLPEQIKSAEPFTYDDLGNLIDITKRFDFTNPDIRYGLIPLSIGLGYGVTQKEKHGGKLNYLNLLK